MRIPHSWPWLLLLGHAPLPALADQATLPPILISASRVEAFSMETPASIRVMERDEIDRSGARTLAELLSSLGGIHVSDPFGDGGGAVLDLRGFGATAGSNTLVLLDGRRLNNSSDLAPPDLSGIDLAQIERIEIVQGSAGTLYGNQAVGGMVNLISRRPQGREAQVQVGGGSFGEHLLRGVWADRLDNGVTYQVTGRQRGADNYRDNSRSDLDQVALRVDKDWQGGRLFFEQEGTREERQLPGSLFADELAADRRQAAQAYWGDYSRTLTQVSRLGLRQELSPIWTLEGDLNYRDSDRNFQTSFRAFPGTESSQTRRLWGFNPRLAARLGDWRLTLGADLEQTDYLLTTSFGPQGVDQGIYGLYGQLQGPLAEGWTGTLGLRHAGVDNAIHTDASDDNLDDQVTVGSAGVTAKLGEHWRWFGRADQNYRFATVEEHTNVVFGQPTGIQNQTGISYETGLEYQHDHWHAKGLIYQLDLEQEISFDSTTYYNINLDQTRRRGLILELDGSPVRGWRWGASYAYTDGIVTDGPFAGNRIPLVPEHQGRLSLDYQFNAGLGLHGEIVRVGSQRLGADYANEHQSLDAYSAVNLALHQDIGDWRLTARVNNLLDATYSETGALGLDTDFTAKGAYFPAPERNFWLQVDYRFNAN